ncbi:MAG: hypothetical protein AB8I08_02660 [Sandaracinaceae bacterium]
MTLQHDALTKDVLDRLVSTVAEVVATPDLASFAIARGVDPARDCHAMGADAVVEIFRTDDPNEALEVERALLTRFAAHERARPEPIQLREPPDDEVVRVFLALWATEGLSS